MFLFWSVAELDEFEKVSEYEGTSINFSNFIDEEPESLSTTIPISIMFTTTMDCMKINQKSLQIARFSS